MSLMRGSGEVIGDRFVLESLAGSGGTGEVYRALDRQTGAPVAVKILYGDRHANLDRFKREAQILSLIDHPRVVRYLAHGIHRTHDPYLVMEWLEGCDLGARLERGPVDVLETVELARGAAEALGALHQQGVVHRDLKPSNLYLVDSQTSLIKLLDLGIAHINHATDITAEGMLVGTAPYMSPEQAAGEGNIDARADVFSLGCVMYECLTGEKAFNGSHALAILTKVLFHDPPQLREKRPDLPRALCSLVNRMLLKNPERRPADGNAVIEALQHVGKILSQQADDTPETTTAESLTQSEQRTVALIFMTAATVADHGDDERLAHESAKYGGRFERLLDGSAVVMLSSATVATDLAAQAARCALTLKRETTNRQIALTLGVREDTGRVHISRAIDRAVSLLKNVSNHRVSNSHVAIDDTTAALLGVRFDVTEVEEGFFLFAERDVVEIRTLLGKPTPCVGRDHELRSIARTYRMCVEDCRAHAVLLVGAAGTGKSRIGQEIVQRLRADGNPPSIWIARGELLGAGSALGMLAQLVRCAFGIRVGEPLGVQQKKLEERIAAHVTQNQQQRCVDFLGEVIGASFSGDDHVQLRSARKDPEMMADQIRCAFIEFLRGEVTAGPVFLLLEDLHWGDAATMRILDHALGELEDAPVFILALARPEVDDLFPRLWSARGLETWRLPLLSKRAAQQLAKHVLGEKTDTDTLERIVTLAEGNAFYLEELIRAAAEGRGTELPDTVVAMVQSRLWKQTDTQRRLLRAASIFGETFWVGAVATLIGHALDPTNLMEDLQPLVDAEIVTKGAESRFVGETEYTFRHALLRECAYTMLTEDDSKLGHRLAGQWLEQHGETDALVLAGHYRKGGKGELAARFYLRVAEFASASGDSNTAVAHAQEGLACGPSEQVRIELLGIICEACGWLLHKDVPALPYAEELMARVAPGSKPWSYAFFAKTSILLVQNNPAALLALVEQVLHLNPSEDAVGPFVLFAGLTALYLDVLGEVRPGDALLARLRTISEQPDMAPVVVANYSNRVCVRILLSGRGNPWDALEHAKKSFRLLQELHHRRMCAISFIMQGVSEWCLGQFDIALVTLDKTLLPERELGHAPFIRKFALGWLHADAGDLDKGHAYAKEFIAATEGLLSIGARGYWLMAEVLRRQGQFEAADREIQIALARAHSVDKPGMYATLAALRLAEGRVTEALDAANTGMHMYEAVGTCCYSRTAFLRVVHAECLHAAKLYAEAQTAITKARTWLLELAAGIPDPAYRDSYLNKVPENKKIADLAQRWAQTNE